MDDHLKEKKSNRGRIIYNGWVKDYLHDYVKFFKQVSCHLESYIEERMYGQRKFEEFTFQQMYEWYKSHQYFVDNPDKGSEKERKQAKDAFNSVNFWLQLDERDFVGRNKNMFQFRKFILDKEQKVNYVIY